MGQKLLVLQTTKCVLLRRLYLKIKSWPTMAIRQTTTNLMEKGVKNI